MILKKGLVALLCFLTAIVGVPAATGAQETSELVPDIAVNITVTDDNGKELNNATADMKLYDSQGNLVAEWKGGNHDTLVSDYAMDTQAGFDLRVDEILPPVSGRVLRSMRIGSRFQYYPLDHVHNFKYGSKYSLVAKYSEPEEVVLTVPAGKIMFNVDAGFAGRKYGYGIGIGEGILDNDKYIFNDMDGTETYIDMPVGRYNAYTYIKENIGGSLGSGGTIDVLSTPTRYVKKTINLNEATGGYFETDGTCVMDGVVYDFTKETAANGVLYILSGSVVNAVLPDANGNVTIYVDEYTYAATFSTGFLEIRESGSVTGGGRNAGNVIFGELVEKSLTAMKAPETGVTLVDMEPGEYTLVQEDVIPGYVKPQDMKITLADTGKVRQIKVVNQRRDGLYQVDGIWYYYVDGAVATDYTGFVENSGGRWYVEKGIVTGTTTGLYEWKSEQYYVVNSKWAYNYTGLVQNAEDWWYVKNGKVDTGYTGIYKSGDSYWYINAGRIDTEYTGLLNQGGTWWYVQKGKVQTEYTGLVNYNSNWWYIKNGKCLSSYEGLVNHNDSWWYVKGGRVQNTYEGLVTYGGNQWYVKGGKVQSTYEGLVKSDGIWWYITDGRVNEDYVGLCYYNDNWWYVKNGRVQADYAGLVNYGGNWWYVRGGKVQNTYEGLVKNGGYWWYVKGGKIQTDYKGLVEYSGNTWYVANGKVDTSFSGLGQHEGVWYCIQAGKVNLSYTGLVQNGGAWWYVRNGILDTSATGLLKSGDSYWLVGNGKLNNTYTGKYIYGGKTFTIVNGKVII